MRLVGVVFAALVTLGLAALQKTDGPGSLFTRAAHVMLSSRSQEPILGPTAAAPVSPAASAEVVNSPAPNDLHTCQSRRTRYLAWSRSTTTGGPAFGTEHFKQYDFLRDEEVVLTFDDGPWPHNTAPCRTIASRRGAFF